GRPHAETQALEEAGSRAKDATVYVTLEPCAHRGKTPSCAEALISAKVARVCVGTVDPDPRTAGKGIQKLEQAGIEVTFGVLESQCKATNAGFFLSITQGRPLIVLKAACTHSGHLNPEEGRWISGKPALDRVHLERSKYDAILIGIGTALADNPMLTARLPVLGHTPVRVVLDSDLRLPEDSVLVKTARKAPLWLIYSKVSDAKEKNLRDKGAKLLKVPRHDLASAMKILAEQGITRLLVEGGPAIHRAFIQAGLYDEMSLYRSQEQLTGRGDPVFSEESVQFQSNKQGLSLIKTEQIGEDLLEIYRRKV
ncbi:MAG: bifunctional diaminohydroxyphosphoribosylaminopyrimidine deaminase/5-amino-6-(5-phosphoribosylamino)uracil reductase RibD, partial [Alphaproteobacteria bacterium]|nr:bifunctional diaminohydroxyphosphoribosylaminopyrimidine deaminase/5-amino-6-(5-phosphoribosylamino)uracil reductase RibD [Alphaproteobacteria bacterium]